MIDLHQSLEELKAHIASVKALLERAERAEAFLREVASGGCRIIHGGHPPSTTCIDKREHALNPENRYSPDYRQHVVDRKDYCEACRATFILSQATPE